MNYNFENSLFLKCFKKRKKLKFSLILFIVFIIILQLIFLTNDLGSVINKLKNHLHSQRNANVKSLRDWHDYASHKRDIDQANQGGLGENGKAAYLNNINYKKAVAKAINETGINTILSDKISLQRSLPDARDQA